MNKQAILILITTMLSSCGVAPSGEYTAKVKVENGGYNYVIPIGCMTHDLRPSNVFDESYRHSYSISLWFELPEVACVSARNHDRFYSPPPTRVMLATIHESKTDKDLAYKRTLMRYIYQEPKSDQAALPIKTATRIGRELIFPTQFKPIEDSDPKFVYTDPANRYVASCRDMTLNVIKSYVGSCQITLSDNQREIEISFNPKFWNRRIQIVESIKKYIRRFEEGAKDANK